MNYWLLSLPREDMEYCIHVGTFGLNRKYILGKVQPGDKIACYINKENKIIGLGEATSAYYMNTRMIFKRDGLFPDRFDFKAVQLGQESEIDFKSLVDDMDFITNKFYWTVYLRAGIAKITQDDWKLIGSKVGN